MQVSKKPRYRQTVRDMLWSMGAVLLVVVFQLAVTHRGHQQVSYSVDYQGAIDQAVADKTLSILVPTQIPQGFKATAARFEAETLGEPGDVRLYLGFTSTDNSYVSVWQSNGHSSEIVDQGTNHASCEGSVDIGASTWQLCNQDRPLTRSLVKVADHETVVVSGNVSADELAAFTSTLRVAK